MPATLDELMAPDSGTSKSAAQTSPAKPAKSSGGRTLDELMASPSKASSSSSSSPSFFAGLEPSNWFKDPLGPIGRGVSQGVGQVASLMSHSPIGPPETAGMGRPEVFAAFGQPKVAADLKQYNEQAEVAKEKWRAHIHDVVKSYNPDPKTTGLMYQTIQGIARVGSEALLGGPMAAPVVGATETEAKYRELKEAGVDDKTATDVAAVTGAMMAAGIVMPMAFGAGIVTKAVTGGTSNVLLGMAGRKAEHEILKNGGYTQLANQSQVFEPSAIALDALIGGGFGALVGARPKEAAEILRDPENLKKLEQLEEKHGPGVKPDADFVKPVDPKLAEYLKKRWAPLVEEAKKPLEDIAKAQEKQKIKAQKDEQRAREKELEPPNLKTVIKGLSRKPPPRVNVPETPPLLEYKPVMYGSLDGQAMINDPRVQHQVVNKSPPRLEERLAVAFGKDESAVDTHLKNLFLRSIPGKTGEANPNVTPEPKTGEMTSVEVHSEEGKPEGDVESKPGIVSTVGKRLFTAEGKQVTAAYGLWKDLHTRMKPLYQAVANILGRSDGLVGTAHYYLDEMISATDHPALKSLLESIRKHVDDFDIFKKKPKAPGAEGEYAAGPHFIRMLWSKSFMNDWKGTATLIHEIVHGATTRFMYLFPNHKSVVRLRELRNEAYARAQRMAKDLGVDIHTQYGFSEVHQKSSGIQHLDDEAGPDNKSVDEFLTEAMSNPIFQRTLMLSEKYATPGFKIQLPLVNEVAKAIREMFGIKGVEEAKLLDEVFHHGQEVMKEQAALTATGAFKGEWWNRIREITKASKKPEMTADRARLKEIQDSLGQKLWGKNKERDPELRKKIQEQYDEIQWRRLQADNAAERLDNSNKMVPAFPGFGPRLPIGTRLMASHGFRYPEPTKAVVVGHSAPISTNEGLMFQHIVDFGNGDERRIARSNISEVMSPRPVTAIPLNQLSASVRDALDGVDPGPAPKAAPALGPDESPFERAFSYVKDAANTVPAIRTATGKIAAYTEEIIRNIAPEGLGKNAQLAAAHIAKSLTTMKSRDAQTIGRSAERRAFWDRNLNQGMDFIDKFETGQAFTDPTLRAAAEAYRNWMGDLAARDKELKINYEPQENYISHLFEDPEQVSFELTKRYGTKWGDPYFMKDRVGRTFKELVDHGYVPRYKNPEDIFLARDHASNVAHMQIEMLQDLERSGLAVKIETGKRGENLTDRPEGFAATPRRAPNGKRYWVEEQTYQVIHNAFDSKSLWSAGGIAGDAYRGMMGIKNHIVPLRLFGLFHAMHVGSVINNAAALTRASKSLLAGSISPKAWLKDVATGLIPGSGLWSSSANRILQAYYGKLDATKLSQSDQLLLTYMNEGGLVPGMSSQDRMNGMDLFAQAMRRGEYLKATTRTFSAALAAFQYPMFHIWIPNMKIAAYTKDIATALHLNPELVTNTDKRRLAFRKISKSVDNRFGEMSYDTLFINRWVKDLAVLNTLSLGWQVGFIREYGGGGVEIVKAPFTKGGLQEKARTGQLDRALFAAFYVAMATAVTGLMSKALSNMWPTGEDYFYPRTGEMNSDGTPKRVNTPFFTREIASIMKHVKAEGLMAGMTDLVEAKGSGVWSTMKEVATGVNSLGQEIRDPDGTLYQKLKQTVGALLKENQPIAMQKSSAADSVKAKALSFAGFNEAPKYATQPEFVTDIKKTFQKYHGRPLTPYENAAYSDEVHELRKYQDSPDDYDRMLDAIQFKYDLTDNEIAKLDKKVGKGEDPTLTLFGQLDWRQQKKILDKHWNEMSEDQQEDYLKRSNKEHLRDNYEPPQ